MIKRNKIPLIVQANLLQLHFPDSKYFIKNDILTWKGYLQPNVLSQRYLIKIEYKVHCHPDVFVLSPKPLLLPSGKTELEHVYDTKTQKLCIYYRNSLEWYDTMLIVNTIIPWTSEWLLHYEYWVTTGVWHGGGIH